MNQRAREILEYVRDDDGELNFEHLAEFLEGLEQTANEALSVAHKVYGI